MKSEQQPDPGRSRGHSVTRDVGWGHRLLSAAAILAIATVLIVPQLGKIGGDAVLDWLSVNGLKDGFTYGTPVGQLAEHYGVEFPDPPHGFPDQDAWLHPRSPGLLTLLTPLRLFSLETVSDWSRVIAGLTWVVVAMFMVPLLQLRQSSKALAALVLATASAPVLMLLEFGPHLGVVALLIAASWYFSLKQDSVTAGVLAGLTAVVRPTFGLLIVGLLLAKRPRSALAAALTWLGVEAIGFLVLDIEPAHFLEVNATATDQWLAVPTNGSIAALTSQFLGSEVSILLALVGTLGLVGLVYMRYRWSQLSLAGWMTMATVGGLLASPVLWEQYLLVLVVPFSWALQRLPARGLWIAATSVGLSQVGLLIVRRLAADSSVRGVLIAIAAAALIVPMLYAVWFERRGATDRVLLHASGETVDR
jgi:hypothetical protein